MTVPAYGPALPEGAQVTPPGILATCPLSPFMLEQLRNIHAGQQASMLRLMKGSTKGKCKGKRKGTGHTDQRTASDLQRNDIQRNALQWNDLR